MCQHLSRDASMRNRRTCLWFIYFFVCIDITCGNYIKNVSRAMDTHLNSPVRDDPLCKKCKISYRYSLMEGYSIVAQAYHRANESFFKATRFYDSLKKEKLMNMNSFLDEVKEFNSLRARNIKVSIMRKYRERPLKGFMKDSLSIEEVVDYVEHCLKEPAQTEADVRSSFLTLIDNFKDSRRFELVNVCAENLPDEVMTAHCIIHKSVLLRDALNDRLLTVFSAKVRYFVKVINSTLTVLEDCMNTFIPNFTEQITSFNASEGKSELYSLADDLALSEDEFDEEQFENAYTDERDTVANINGSNITKMADNTNMFIANNNESFTSQLSENTTNILLKGKTNKLDETSEILPVYLMKTREFKDSKHNLYKLHEISPKVEHSTKSNNYFETLQTQMTPLTTKRASKQNGILVNPKSVQFTNSQRTLHELKILRVKWNAKRNFNRNSNI